MGHFNFKQRKVTPSAAHPDWLRVSSAVGRMVNDWAGRYDVAAFAAPGAGEGHPAFFNPYTSEVEVNVEKCFGSDTDPKLLEDLDLRERQYEWPRATGAVFHEALHARISLWDVIKAQSDLTPAEFNALILFEEGRIEKQGLTLFPRNAAFLRTMALDIVVGDIDDIASGSDTQFAANVAALTLARVDAGSLLEEDVEAIREVIETKLSKDTLDKMQELWRQAQAHTDHTNPAKLYDLAREWTKLVSEQAEANGDAPGDMPGEGMDGSMGGGGSGDGAMSEFMKQVEGALSEAADMATIAAYDDITDVETMERWENEAKSKSSAAKDRKDSENISSEVFGKGTTDVHGTRSSSELQSKRQPTGPERAAAVTVARMLEKAKYRDRDAHEVSSVVPPGRLRTRAAMQGAALKSKGIMSQAEPWRRTVRKHTEDPTLSIGVMVDISGSMGGAMVPMAVSAWVLSEAVRRVQGRAAMVYYGNDVFPTLKPGQHLDQVNIWSAPDMTEKFDKGFKAVDGALGLTWGTGARLLVVVSDGCYTHQERAAAQRAMGICQRSGVGVLWLNMSAYKSGDAERIVNGTNAVLLNISGDPVKAATEIGNAAAKALEAAH